MPIAWGLRRLGLRTALPLAGLLYLIGLGGDSYYGLAAQVPALKTAYDAIFQVFSYTRNGLLYVPLFLLLGAAGPLVANSLGHFCAVLALTFALSAAVLAMASPARRIAHRDTD